MIINVIIAEKNAIAMPHEALVCGNSDYIIDFKFDAEWDAHPTKTARFIYDDRSFTDVVFTGNQCPVPVLNNTHEVIVGVYAGNLRTTTPAYLRCERSILCYSGEKTEPSPDVYDQIMERVNDIENTTSEVEGALTEMNSARGLYIVRVTGDYKSDRSLAEIREAIDARKTCLLVSLRGAVYTYCGERKDHINIKETALTFYAPPDYCDTDHRTLVGHYAQIHADGSVTEVTVANVKAVNPNALTFEIDGETIRYDGTNVCRITIPTGVTLTVDADGNATI